MYILSFGKLCLTKSSRNAGTAYIDFNQFESPFYSDVSFIGKYAFLRSRKLTLCCFHFLINNKEDNNRRHFVYFIVSVFTNNKLCLMFMNRFTIIEDWPKWFENKWVSFLVNEYIYQTCYNKDVCVCFMDNLFVHYIVMYFVRQTLMPNERKPCNGNCFKQAYQILIITKWPV